MDDRWHWGSFWVGTLLAMLFILFLVAAYQIGKVVAWDEASLVAGCDKGTRMTDVQDYVRGDNGQIQRWTCEEPRSK